MNLNNNGTEIPEVQLEEYASKLDAKDFACQKQKDLPAFPQEKFPLGRELGLMLNQWNIFSPIMK